MLRSLLVLVLGVAGAGGCGSGARSARDPDGGHRHEHAPGHGHAHGSADHGFSDVARWTKEFDDPARDAWQKPEEVVRLLALQPGMTVADVGAGTGYFGERLSEAVGANGKVIALDVEPNMVAFMKDRFAREGLANAEARLCPEDSTGLEAASVDRILVVDTWHHIGRRPDYARHLASVLRPGGFVAVVDFTLETHRGPPKEHRIAPEQAIRELAAGGLDASVVEETLPDQYVVVAKKR